MRQRNPLATLRYLVEAHDVPDHIRDKGRKVLDAHTRAERLNNTARTRLGELRELAADARRNIAPALRAEILAGKRHTLTALLEKSDTTEHACELASREERETERARNYFAEVLPASMITQHRTDLLAWVATRRGTDHNATGYTDLIAPEVEGIYDMLSVVWYPSWPDGIELRGNLRLPIVYDERWTVTEQRHVAWCWQQVAAGNAKWVHNPNDKTPKNTTQVLRITAWVDELPQIKRPKPTTRTAAKRFGFGKA